MQRDELNLELERRRNILQLVQEFPGLHLSEIARRLQWSPVLAEYHLRMLERHDLIGSVQEAHYHRYFPKIEREGMKIDTLGAQEKRVLSLMRHPVRLHILVYLAAGQEGRNKDIARSLGLSRPATTYQLARLLREGLVAKDDQEVYHLVDAALVTRLLMMYQPPKDVVDQFKELWDKLSTAA